MATCQLRKSAYGVSVAAAAIHAALDAIAAMVEALLDAVALCIQPALLTNGEQEKTPCFPPNHGTIGDQRAY